MVSLSRSTSDVASEAYGDSVPRFPHVRALLGAMARAHRSAIDNYDSEGEGDGQVSSGFVSRVVGLLDEEHEEELKGVLKEHYNGLDDDTLEQYMLELMHKHRDDVAGVPFLLLSSSRRPISRPSSRASARRPETPTLSSAPSSPLAYVFRRPHTPLASPLSTGVGQNSYIGNMNLHPSGESPQASPTLSYSAPNYFAGASLPASPLSSPRLLNAKANEFRPHPRPLSAASSNPGSYIRADSPDLWSHGTSRGPSNLAIASPIIPDSSLLSRSGTPSSLRASMRPDELEDDNDPFDPFSKDVPVFPSILASDYEPAGWEIPGPPIPGYENYDGTGQGLNLNAFSSPLMSSELSQDSLEDDGQEILMDGMTPFDVLSSVFGASLAPSELEDALANNAYDFDRAMAWLIDRMAPPQQSPGPIPSRTTTQIGGRNVAVISRDGPGAAGFVRGGRSGGFPPGQRGNTRFVNGRPVPGGNRVCRYFLAGECLRADCRFSHDLERALCRFWLRGTCAKGEACEFLHHLPENVDISNVTNQFAQVNLRNNGADNGRRSPGLEEFPSLGAAGRGAPAAHDPGRTRFAAAVKKPPGPTPPTPPRDEATMAARREAMGSAADSLHHRTAIIAPKPSNRLKLRPPSLLPTLATGAEVNAIYMQYRSRALQLGAARNACLSRAADAWRRGDGGAAKRFSREGHELNAKMSSEMAQAAARLVRERARAMQFAARSRDPSWSDDPGDSRARGAACGAGLGVVLGVARTDVIGVEKGALSPEERTEAALDLHALHSNEAVEVLEESLLALEREHFYGLVYLVVGEEKHTGAQNTARGSSRLRLAAGVKEWLHRWGYPWSERDGVICVDPLTHL